MNMGMKNALRCFLLLVIARFGFWGVFPFVVRCFLLLVLVFEIELILKNLNRHVPLLARFGICRCFHLKIALLVLVFCWYEKPKRATKGQNKSIWRPGFCMLTFKLRRTFFLPYKMHNIIPQCLVIPESLRRRPSL